MLNGFIVVGLILHRDMKANPPGFLLGQGNFYPLGRVLSVLKRIRMFWSFHPIV